MCQSHYDIQCLAAFIQSQRAVDSTVMVARLGSATILRNWQQILGFGNNFIKKKKKGKGKKMT